VLGVFATVIIAALTRFQLFARPGERDGRGSVLGYSIPILAALCLGHGREEIGLLTLIVLAFGDGSATLTGLTFGGKPLPWNTRKSWTGTLSFIVFATVIGSIIYWGEALPAVPFTIALTIAFSTATLCALIESLPSKMNDNLRVGSAAALISGALTLLLVG
jgi:dolichol kinase